MCLMLGAASLPMPSRWMQTVLPRALTALTWTRTRSPPPLCPQSLTDVVLGVLPLVPRRHAGGSLTGMGLVVRTLQDLPALSLPPRGERPLTHLHGPVLLRPSPEIRARKRSLVPPLPTPLRIPSPRFSWRFSRWHLWCVSPMGAPWEMAERGLEVGVGFTLSQEVQKTSQHLFPDGLVGRPTTEQRCGPWFWRSARRHVTVHLSSSQTASGLLRPSVVRSGRRRISDPASGPPWTPPLENGALRRFSFGRMPTRTVLRRVRRRPCGSTWETGSPTSSPMTGPGLVARTLRRARRATRWPPEGFLRSSPSRSLRPDSWLPSERRPQRAS